MSLETTYPHLQRGADGVLRVAGSRYTARHLAAEHYAYGWSAEELLRQHPDLRPQEVYAALAWFYDHFDEVVETLITQADAVEPPRQAQPLTRAALLERD
jgi:uncharacterized protein (DUF433 family)